MAHFQVSINGKPWIEDYWCSGRYDVANELFGDERGMANVAVSEKNPYEFILLDYDNAKLTLTPIADGQP